ncbi:hypothetical protein C8J56DRAFT_1156617 [Mycena floridula]|nr:hypothetical protein C8J56DRAFT_1156617 [Mycena floridula]
MPPKPKGRSSGASSRQAPRRPGQKKEQADSTTARGLGISGPPIFSQEIFDLIIDYNHDKPRFLKKCSLVCRGWLPSSRLHLLAHTSVDINKRSELAWMKVIRSPLATIGHYIRSVQLEATNVGPLKFQHCLERLDRIESLHIYHGIIPPDVSSPIFSKVTGLVLESEFLSFDDLFRFIATFPQLERLSLHCDRPGLAVQWSDIEPASQMTPMPPSLRCVELFGPKTTGTFVAWFFQQVNRPVITELTLIGPEDAALTLLRTVGSHLTTLRFALTDRLSYDHLDLAQCPHLGVLFIEVQQQFWKNQSLLHWLGTAQPKLQKLSLFFGDQDCNWIQSHCFASFLWNDLDAVLSLGPFSEIEVICRWFPSKHWSRIQPFLKMALLQSYIRHDVAIKISLKRPCFDFTKFNRQLVEIAKFVPPPDST